MRILDDQGRLFGKINMIDAGVVVVVAVLIPIAYGAYLLFRAPAARITAIEPARAPEGLSQITIRGENLRPYLRVGVGNQEFALLFENAALAVLPLPRLGPGSYDIVLYDESQELDRLPGALVIEGTPTIAVEPAVGSEVESAQLVVAGSFQGLEPSAAKGVSATLATGPKNQTVTVLGFRPPEESLSQLESSVTITSGTYQVRAVLRIRCVPVQNECRFQGVAVRPGAALPMKFDGRAANFTVAEIHSVRARPLRLTVRTIITEELATMLAVSQQVEDDRFPALDALRPSLESIRAQSNLPDARQQVVAVLRVPAVRTQDGWLHQANVLQVGGEFSFERPTYRMFGTITSIEVAR